VEVTISPWAVKLSWFENAYSHPLLSGWPSFWPEILIRIH